MLEEAQPADGPHEPDSQRMAAGVPEQPQEDQNRRRDGGRSPFDEVRRSEIRRLTAELGPAAVVVDHVGGERHGEEEVRSDRSTDQRDGDEDLGLAGNPRNHACDPEQGESQRGGEHREPVGGALRRPRCQPHEERNATDRGDDRHREQQPPFEPRVLRQHGVDVERDHRLEQLEGDREQDDRRQEHPERHVSERRSERLAEGEPGRLARLLRPAPDADDPDVAEGQREPGHRQR